MYNSCMKILLIISAVLLSTFNPAAASQTLKEIMTPPADSADRENLRIWVPVERRSKCRLTVDILGDRNQIIRHLVKFLAGPGYYNFYLDKKTDSGTFVESNNYGYEIKDCTTHKRGQLKVAYSGIVIEVKSAFGYFGKEVFADSANLKIEYFSALDSLIDTVVDTTLKTGFHKLRLSGPDREDPESYFQQIRIDGKIVERKRNRTIEEK